MISKLFGDRKREKIAEGGKFEHLAVNDFRKTTLEE